MDYRKVGSILFLNLITNTKELKDLYDAESLESGEETVFSKLLPKDLYSRLLSDIDFSRLSEEDKTAFLFLKPEYAQSVDKQELHDLEMQNFVTEAHNRACANLGVPKTNIVFCDFSKNPLMDYTMWTLYSTANNNIYFNLEKDYSIARPSMLVENINAVTRHQSIYLNILKALKEPSSLSDREYFLALSTAVKAYVYQELRENDPQAYQIESAADYSTPNCLEEVVYSFNKTRQDFQSAGIYGGKLQQDLRRNEQTFHNYLQNELLVNSMINLEDIFAYFEQSPLNQDSNGLLGNILKALVATTAPSFYNSLGADMILGQTLSQYIDELEQEMFEEYGIEVPTKEEIDEFIDSEEFAEQEMLDQIRTQYPNRKLSAFEDGEEGDDQDEVAEDDEMPQYRKMDDALPQEGKIDQIQTLPFHNYINMQNQDGAQ